MSENDQPANSEIEELIETMPILVKFVHLKPGEEISIELVEVIEGGSDAKLLARGAKIVKSKKTDGNNTEIDQITVSRSQLLTANRWYSSLPDGLGDKAIVALFKVGRQLIDITDIIRPELPPKPTV